MLVIVRINMIQQLKAERFYQLFQSGLTLWISHLLP